MLWSKLIHRFPLGKQSQVKHWKYRIKRDYRLLQRWRRRTIHYKNPSAFNGKHVLLEWSFIL